MGMVLNGAGSQMSSSVFRGTASVKGQAKASGGIGVRKGNSRTQPKKSLKYNPREISSQIVRAKKSRNASIVLIRARSKLSVLLSQSVSGKYDEGEIRVALAHARKMVECARLKVTNLKEEEILKTRDDRTHGTKEIQKRAKIRQKVKKKENAARAEVAIEEGKQALEEKLKQQQLRQKRRMHRNDEQSKIAKADLEYLKDQMKNQKESGTVKYNGVSLDLSNEAVSLAQLEQLEQQLTQQAEVEAELELAAMEGAMAEYAPSDTGTAVGADGGAPVSASFDITA